MTGTMWRLDQEGGKERDMERGIGRKAARRQDLIHRWLLSLRSEGSRCLGLYLTSLSRLPPEKRGNSSGSRRRSG